MDTREPSFWSLHNQKFKQYLSKLSPITNIIAFSSIIFTIYAYFSEDFEKINVKIFSININIIIITFHILCLYQALNLILIWTIDNWNMQREKTKTLESLRDITKQIEDESSHFKTLAIREMHGPDENGHFCRHTPMHSRIIYFETSTPGEEMPENINNIVIQAFSFDKINWRHVKDVDYFPDPENYLTKGDRIFIKRIHYENLLSGKSYKRSDLNNVSEIKLTKDRNKIKELHEIVPKEYLCPLTHKIMKNPVIVPNGCTFDKESVMFRISKSGKFNVLSSSYSIEDVYPNLHLHDVIQKWLETNDALECNENE